LEKELGRSNFNKTTPKALKSMTLLDLKKGEWGEITRVDGDESLCLRLLEMGFTPGESIRYVARALFDDPVAVNLRGTLFALRTREANCIQVSAGRTKN